MEMQDLTGQKFGRLTAIKFDHKYKRRAYWLCKCDCGAEKVVYAGHLRNGHTQSCGCYAREQTSKTGKRTAKNLYLANTTHGGAHERLYGVWASMLTRCEDKNVNAYKWYGARGVKVCNEWKDYAVFRTWALSHGYDDKAKTHECTIDRIDVNGDYCPENCRWVDAKAQSNNRRSNKRFSYNGKIQNIGQWADEYGLPYKTLHARLMRYGWGIEKALETPIRGR